LLRNFRVDSDDANVLHELASAMSLFRAELRP